MKGLYAIVDPRLCAGRDPLLVASQILDGGCAVLQLRDKGAQAPERARLAGELARLCRNAGVPFVVNDHVALAREVGAWGAHLGQEDMGLGEARRRGPGLALGLSTHSLEQARAALREGADLIGFGPVFATSSKERPDPLVGLEGLRAVCSDSPLPVVAIGGIGTDQLPEVLAAGASLVAAISAICQAPDVRRAARDFHDRVRSGA